MGDGPLSSQMQQQAKRRRERVVAVTIGTVLQEPGDGAQVALHARHVTQRNLVEHVVHDVRVRRVRENSFVQKHSELFVTEKFVERVFELLVEDNRYAATQDGVEKPLSAWRVSRRLKGKLYAGHTGNHPLSDMQMLFSELRQQFSRLIFELY